MFHFHSYIPTVSTTAGCSTVYSGVGRGWCECTLSPIVVELAAGFAAEPQISFSPLVLLCFPSSPPGAKRKRSTYSIEMERDSGVCHDGDSAEARPYRSHLYPACLPCKKRKSRCRTTDSSGKCIMCRAHGTDCTYPRPGNNSQRGSVASPRKLTPKSRQAPRTAAQPKKSQQAFTHPVDAVSPSRDFAPRTTSRPAAILETQSCPPSHEHFTREAFPNLVGIVTEVGDNSSHIVSPVVAEDNDVLESYLSTVPDARRRSIIRTDPNSRRPVRPVLFNTVPRRPLGVSATQSLPATKCEFIEKYLEPEVNDIVDL